MSRLKAVQQQDFRIRICHGLNVFEGVGTNRVKVRTRVRKEWGEVPGMGA